MKTTKPRRSMIFVTLTPDAMSELGEQIALEAAEWRRQLGVPDGLVIPEEPIPEDDDALLDAYIECRQEKEALFDLRTAPDCPQGQEGAALDSRYSVVMNRTATLQCELRDRLRKKLGKRSGKKWRG